MEPGARLLIPLATIETIGALIPRYSTLPTKGWSMVRNCIVSPVELRYRDSVDNGKAPDPLAIRRMFAVPVRIGDGLKGRG
jgi:hypothetical protein